MARHVYVHIPFCLGKCGYCSFYSIPCNRDNDLIRKYYDACKRETDSFASRKITDINSDSIPTVYFGGGTPSLAPASYNVELLNHIVSSLELSSNAEKTIEVNPATVDFEYLKEIRGGGFNRISIGVQSLHDDVLRTIGRRHDSNAACRAISEAAEAGFDNISADLIIGIPGQKYDDVISDADRLISLGVKHISMYSLSIEEGTPFYEKYGDRLYEYFPEDLERQIYHGLRGHLSLEGIVPYEISNCGRDGYYSRHNLSYWNGFEYYAIGAGSHGYLENIRFSHDDDVLKYIESALTYVEEEMNPDSKMHEYVILRLRTSDGVVFSDFRDRFGIDFEETFAEPVRENIEKNLIELGHGSCRLTKKGLDFANLVFCDFL